jgi:hypothetical protein
MENVIDKVMEYYQVNIQEAINIIKLRRSCGEYDELLRDMKEEENDKL